MPRPSNHSPEKIARTVAAVKAGLDLRAAGVQAGVSHQTVARWVKDAKASPALVPAPPDPAPAPPDLADDLPEDLVALLKMLIKEGRGAAAAARHAGNHAAVQSFLSNVTKLSTVLSREEKRAGESADHVRYSRAEIEAAQKSAGAKLAAYLDRPLLCASCGRALSVDWGHGHAATVAAAVTPKS
jgi:hypothetical protein